MPILHERIVSGRESYRGECVERVWECKEFVRERVRESVSVSVCERVWECVRVSARESESVRVCERVIERWECVREFECVWDLRSIRGCTTCGIRETNYHGAQLIVPPRFMPKLFVKEELRSWELLRARARQEERRTAIVVNSWETAGGAIRGRPLTMHIIRRVWRTGSLHEPRLATKMVALRWGGIKEGRKKGGRKKGGRSKDERSADSLSPALHLAI